MRAVQHQLCCPTPVDSCIGPACEAGLSSDAFKGAYVTTDSELWAKMVECINGVKGREILRRLVYHCVLLTLSWQWFPCSPGRDSLNMVRWMWPHHPMKQHRSTVTINSTRAQLTNPTAWKPEQFIKCLCSSWIVTRHGFKKTLPRNLILYHTLYKQMTKPEFESRWYHCPGKYCYYTNRNANSLDLNLADFLVRGALQQKVYLYNRSETVYHLKNVLLNCWDAAAKTIIHGD